MLDQLVMGDCDHLQTMLLAELRVHTHAPPCSDTEESFDGPTSPPPSNTTNLTHFYRCKKAMWTALQNDPRFPPVKRECLPTNRSPPLAVSPMFAFSGRSSVMFQFSL